MKTLPQPDLVSPKAVPTAAALVQPPLTNGSLQASRIVMVLGTSFPLECFIGP